jgi:hypothetical protein
MVVSIAVKDQKPVNYQINQTYIVEDTPMKPYDIWVVIDGRDTHLIIQAKDSLQARSIAESLYGRCYGVTGPLAG